MRVCRLDTWLPHYFIMTESGLLGTVLFIMHKNMKYLLWMLPFILFLIGYYSAHYWHYMPSISTPDIVGYQLPHALKQISQHQLCLQLFAEQEEPHIPEGTILSQIPSAGSNIKQHQVVYCVVSKKPLSLSAKNFTNIYESDIQKELAHTEFHTKYYRVTSDKPNNLCIAQHPSPEHLIEHNGMIIYLSNNNDNKLVICPSFIHQPLTFVKELLQDNPAIELHIENKSFSLNPSLIINQRPLPGSLISLHHDNPTKLILSAS